MSEYITTHEELLKLHGANVTCKILDIQIDDAKICVEGEWVFVCQNLKSGNSARDKLGYKYSWQISCGADQYTPEHNWGCVEIKLVKTDDAKVEPVDITLTSGTEVKVNKFIKELDERLDKLTPAVVLNATKTWDNFTKVLNELYHKAEKIQSLSTLEKFTRKVKELV